MSDAAPVETLRLTAASAGNVPLALREVVAQLIAVDPGSIPEDVSLIELGLDSVAMMRIPTLLKKFGYNVAFKDLARHPTLGSWLTLLNSTSDAKEEPPAETNTIKTAGGRFPLTPIQQAYLLGRDASETLGGVACHLYCEFNGHIIEPGRLEAAVHQLCRRHATLRARFFADGSQEIMTDSPWQKLIVHDLSDHGEKDAGEYLERLRDRLSHRLLDVFNGQVFDIQLSRLSNGRCRIHFNIDLLVADVRSITIILRDLAVFYDEGETDGQVPPTTFQSYLSARSVNQSEAHQADAAYWKPRLGELPSAPGLPLARDPAHIGPTRFSRRAFHLSETQFRQFSERARMSGITVAAALATAFSDVLARWSGDGRFLLNIPIFDRKEIDPNVAHMVADFTNLLLLEVNLAGEANFASRAQALQSQLHQDLAHSAYSGIEVIRDLTRLGRPRGRIAPIVFASNITDRLVSDEFEASLGQLGWSLSQTPQVWLDHQIYRLGDGLLLNWDAVDDLFPIGMLDQMFGAYQRHIERLCEEHWELPLKISLPSNQLVTRERVNATAAPIDTRLLHEPFLENAERAPNSPAVSWLGGELTYRDLLARAQRLAAQLQAGGIASGDHVAVIFEKGPAQIIAVMATLLVGAVYVPIVVDSPPERMNKIIRDAQCSAAIIASQRHTGTWPAGILRIDPSEDGASAPLLLDTRIDFGTNRSSTDLAYIIYTSGSTGTPKGVMIDHRGALNTVLDINRRWSITDRDRIFALSSLAFDLSVYDIFGALAAGACIVLPDDSGRRDPEHWISVLSKTGATVWNSVPALMEMLVEFSEHTNSLEFPGSLRLALLSGDWIPVSLPDRIRRLSPDIRLIALGGATEASIWSNWFDIHEVPTKWSSIPYGYPLANQRYHVLDSSGEPAPDWVPGDLYIAGIGLANGYWNDPKKTDSSFINTPTWGRLYKTGDRACYWPDGTLEFLGRRDAQVKIGGHRVELGEIEAALVRVAGIQQATADFQIVEGQSQIIAYVAIDPASADGPGGVIERRSASLNPSAVRDAVRNGANAVAAQLPQSIDPAATEEFWHKVEALSIHAIVRTFRRAGYFVNIDEQRSIDDLLHGMKVLPRYQKLLGQWLALLVRNGILNEVSKDTLKAGRMPAEEEFSARWGELAKTDVFGASTAPIMDYLHRSIDAHLSMLCGDVDPLEIYFKDGSTDAAEGIYRFNPFMEYLNGIAAEALRGFINQRIDTGHADILEVGAGTGGTTASLLPALPADDVAYEFTDLSEFFLDAARLRFVDYPFLTFGRFDINIHPAVQGRPPASKDAIVAINVIHDARSIPQTLRNLRATLKPGGLLLLIEATENCALQMISIAFIEGLSDYEDDRTESNLPFLTHQKWREKLLSAGFATVDVFPIQDDAVAAFAQRVIVAYAPDQVFLPDGPALKAALSSSLPEYMIPKNYILLDELPLSSNGKVDRSRLPRFVQAAHAPRNGAEKPSPGIEADIASIWEDVLKVGTIFAGDDFFELGGDSLLATRVIGEVNRRIGVRVSIRRLFEDPCLRTFAAAVRAQRDQSESGAPPLSPTSN